MPDEKKKHLRRFLPHIIFIMHISLHITLGIFNWIRIFELFNLLLLVTNLTVLLMLIKGRIDTLEGVGMMIIIAGHALIGQHLAPDLLTSGTILMVNMLILYVGSKVFRELSTAHCIIFTGSYFLLFAIFILWMSNAEPLFMLSLLGLAATARNLKLVAYFWCLVLSFTVCQPYAWEALIISFFILKVLFSAKSRVHYSITSIVFLGCGLVLLFLVLLPVPVMILGESPHAIINILKDGRIRDAILLTLVTATISTIFLALFCVPLSFAISRLEFFGKSLLLSLIDVPIVIPRSVAGIAILRVFSKQQFLGETLFHYFGIRFDGTVLGICLAQVFVSLPFIMKSSIAAFDGIPRQTETAARILGASSFGSFWRVSLPLAGKGVFLGAVLAWARSAGEFGALLFVAPHPETAPIVAYNRFMSTGLTETAPLVAMLLMFSLIMFFLLQLVARTMRTAYQVERN